MFIRSLVCGVLLQQPNQTEMLGMAGLSLTWVTGPGHFEPITTPGSIIDSKSWGAQAGTTS